jgi:hypothetical protein
MVVMNELIQRKVILLYYKVSGDGIPMGGSGL